MSFVASSLTRRKRPTATTAGQLHVSASACPCGHLRGPTGRCRVRFPPPSHQFKASNSVQPCRIPRFVQGCQQRIERCTPPELTQNVEARADDRQEGLWLTRLRPSALCDCNFEPPYCSYALSDRGSTALRLIASPAPLQL